MTPEQLHAEACNVRAAIGHAGDYDDEINELMAALKRAFDTGKADPRSDEEWVPVEGRKPTLSKYVLICLIDNDGRRLTAEAQWFGAHWSAHQFGRVPEWRVTHWREKPAPPEAE